MLQVKKSGHTDSARPAPVPSGFRGAPRSGRVRAKCGLSPCSAQSCEASWGLSGSPSRRHTLAARLRSDNIHSDVLRPGSTRGSAQAGAASSAWYRSASPPTVDDGKRLAFERSIAAFIACEAPPRTRPRAPAAAKVLAARTLGRGRGSAPSPSREPFARMATTRNCSGTSGTETGARRCARRVRGSRYGSSASGGNRGSALAHWSSR